VLTEYMVDLIEASKKYHSKYFRSIFEKASGQRDSSRLEVE
jgi:hypothetical protein